MDAQQHDEFGRKIAVDLAVRRIELMRAVAQLRDAIVPLAGPEATAVLPIGSVAYETAERLRKAGKLMYDPDALSEVGGLRLRIATVHACLNALALPDDKYTGEVDLNAQRARLLADATTERRGRPFATS